MVILCTANRLEDFANSKHNYNYVVFQSVMAIEGNVMKETHRDPNDPSAEVTYITRTFNNDEMIVVSFVILNKSL